MDAFTQGYIDAALWSSTDDDGEPLDEDYGIEDISPDTLRDMEADCADFQESNEELLSEAYDLGEDDARAGHDFWLTRNGHGAGFWDRGLGKVGDELTDAAKAYGGQDLYVGDDDFIYS